jgi:hypothetical protein
MSKYISITATAQGLVSITENSSRFQQYETRHERTAQRRSEQGNRRQFHAIQEGRERESLHLNPIQRTLYRRLMYGLKEFSPEQVAAMSPRSIERIAHDHSRAEKLLQALKSRTYYQRYFAAETKLLNSIFSEAYKARGREFAPIGEKFSDNMGKLPDSATLNKLGISTARIVGEFMEKGLLPANFLQLTPDRLSL